MNNNLPARHGDVDLIRVESIPAGAKELPVTDEFVLALGETTGHKHRIHSGEFKVFEIGSERYISTLTPLTISHEEHRTYTLPGGAIYKQEQEEEYDPFQEVIRRVVD